MASEGVGTGTLKIPPSPTSLPRPPTPPSLPALPAPTWNWTIVYFDFDREYAKAKKCMKNLVASACSFSSSEQELLDLGFSDHNPFCENNRDPGATGNDQCFGVKELNNPFHSSNPTKTANLRAVLFLVLAALLFVI